MKPSTHNAIPDTPASSLLAPPRAEGSSPSVHALTTPTPDPEPSEVYQVIEPAPTPEPIPVPAIYAQPVARANLTEEQARLLDQAAKDFNARIQGSGMTPFAPGYADLWKQAAQQADDVFRQQYGDDALQALKGPAPAPTPEPTPLSAEDDAYRARYGDDALEMRILQREGRLIRVPQ